LYVLHIAILESLFLNLKKSRCLKRKDLVPLRSIVLKAKIVDFVTIIKSHLKEIKYKNPMIETHEEEDDIDKFIPKYHRDLMP